MIAGLYAYTKDLQQIDACRPENTTRLPHAMSNVITPLHWQEWESALADHPDQRFNEYIIDGIRYGFRVGVDYATALCCFSIKNLPSQVVGNYLAQECAQGRILGLLNPKEFPQVHTSQFGIIPKNTPGSWQLIVDLLPFTSTSGSKCQ